MISRFVEEYAKKLASNPEVIRVEFREAEGQAEIILFSSQEDMGKFIGKNGKMIRSLKNVLSGCKLKNGVNYKIIVQSI